ncbi:MAG TPA: hypothetical protein VIY73_16245 [Polyangiaceae bacterium]
MSSPREVVAGVPSAQVEALGCNDPYVQCVDVCSGRVIPRYDEKGKAVLYAMATMLFSGAGTTESDACAAAFSTPKARARAAEAKLEPTIVPAGASGVSPATITALNEARLAALADVRNLFQAGFDTTSLSAPFPTAFTGLSLEPVTGLAHSAGAAFLPRDRLINGYPLGDVPPANKGDYVNGSNVSVRFYPGLSIGYELFHTTGSRLATAAQSSP